MALKSCVITTTKLLIIKRTDSFIENIEITFLALRIFYTQRNVFNYKNFHKQSFYTTCPISSDISDKVYLKIKIMEF